MNYSNQLIHGAPNLIRGFFVFKAGEGAGFSFTTLWPEP